MSEKDYSNIVKEPSFDVSTSENDNIIDDANNSDSPYENAICFDCKNVILCEMFYCEFCFEPMHEKCKKTFDATVLCTFCFSKNVINKERSEAVNCTKEQAERMLKLSDRKFGEVSAGKTVRVPKPALDRSKGDPPNVLAMVLEVHENGLYRLGTRDGILKNLYARSQFSVCKENLLSESDIPNEEFSLRTIANAQSLGNGQGMLKCTCTKGCNTKKCTCKKANLLCNSRCQNSTSCCNR